MTTDPHGAPANVSPTWTWGSSATVNLEFTGFGLIKNSQQLAQVTLPEPAVCSIYFQATLRVTDINDSILLFTLNLNTGLGRTTVPRQVSFANQPAISAPLEFTIPFIPVHTLNVDASVQGLHNSVDPANILAVDIFMQLAPITRIPQEIQKLQFGMALPGEADDMDDEMLAELEGEGPSVAETMVAEHAARVEGAGESLIMEHQGEDAPDEEIDELDSDEISGVPAWLLDLVDRMTQRLHRPPSKAELATAVRRIKQRKQRRYGRLKGAVR